MATKYRVVVRYYDCSLHRNDSVRFDKVIDNVSMCFTAKFVQYIFSLFEKYGESVKVTFEKVIIADAK